MTTDEIVYLNLVHLIEKNGITERVCTGCADLSPNFFVNYRKGRTKHFRICDLAKLAAFFDVSIDYLCQYKNTKDEFFRPKYKLKPRDEHVLLYAFKKLDPVGRIKVSEAINAEFEEVKKREKEQILKKKKERKLTEKQ